jgi:hypothetical protein
MELLNSDTRKLIEDRFKYYHKIKKAVELERHALIHGTSSHENIGASPTGRISDPVGTRAAKLADIPQVEIEIEYTDRGKIKKRVEIIKWPERWLRIVEHTQDRFNRGTSPLIAEMITQRYFRQMAPTAVYVEMGIGERTFYDWREDIICCAAMFAIELRVINLL